MKYAQPIKLNPYSMFPEAARLERILQELSSSWFSVVGNAARGSKPYSLDVNELCIYVYNHQRYVESLLTNSTGTILRKMSERWGYKPEGEFSLRFIYSDPSREKPRKKPAKKIVAEVDEEKVRQYMQEAPETLPEDINYAISHLKVFLEQRFPKNITPR